MRMHRRILVVQCCILASVILSCGCTGPSHDGTDPSGTSWELVSFRNETGMQAIIDGTTITAVFGKDGTLSGSAGCNHYTATYATDDDAFSLSEIAWTEMYCLSPEGIMRQETDYLTALKNAVQFAGSNQELTLWGENGTLLLEFTALK
jgi:heat shock protein HslJ